MELEASGIPICCIAGTSMGAAMGAARAIGADLEMIAKLLIALDLNELLQVSDSTAREFQKMIGRSMVEYVRGSTWREQVSPPHDLLRLRELFRLLTAGKRFSDTVIPFAAVAADLESGASVLLREGALCEAIVASTSVPGIFSPVAYEDQYLIDGGVVNKLPVDVVIDMGAEAVVAVDAGVPLTREVSTGLDALLQAQRVTSRRLTDLQLLQAAERLNGDLLVIQPDVGWIRMFGFEHAEEAIQAGREALRAHLDEIRGFVTSQP
jgi:NTE family protein